MYDIKLSHNAVKIYKKLQAKDLKKIDHALSIIEKNPIYFPGKIIQLMGKLYGKYRYKIGDWRIIYTVDQDNEEVNVEAIALRSSNTYRRN
jgi:mRNA interferase RelE/StbE